MKYATLIVTALATLLCGTRTAQAQAIQLPTYRYFSVQTTVSVPDRGGAVLGGVGSASHGSTRRGVGLPGAPFANRASGASIGASSASVHAAIIDHAELDAAVLAEARRQRETLPAHASSPPRAPVDEQVASKAAFLSRHVARPPAESAPHATRQPPAGSLAALRAEAEARQQARLDEAAELLATGIAQEARGKLASARGYYESAARRGDAHVRKEALSRIARIRGLQSAERVVQAP